MDTTLLRDQATEVDLVRRAQAGDQAAFARLAERYRALIYSLTFLRTGRYADAEDLTQDVLVKAWQKLPALQAPEAFVVWLKTITARACGDWHRRARWPESLDVMDDASLIPDLQLAPPQVIIAREQQRALRQALLSLPAANRLALLLHLWGGYPYGRIAELLDIPLTTVEGRIYRAKQQLRCLLREHTADFLGEPRRRWQPEEENHAC